MIEQIIECLKCGQRLPQTEYYYYPSRGSYSKKCKECEKSIKRDEYKGRQEKAIATVHAYREANRDKIKARAREKYKNNVEYRESQLCYQHEYRMQNKRKTLEYATEYRRTNKDSINLKRSEYAKTDAGKVLDRRHDCRRRAARKSATVNGQHSHGEWLEVLKRFNHQCAICGSTEQITQDHIIPITKGGNDSKDNLQPLCRRCNSAKRAQTLRFVPQKRHQVALELI